MREPPGRRRRLLVAFHEEYLNGATIAVLRLIEPLTERGWDVAFWVPRPGPAHDLLRERYARVEGARRPIASGLAALRLPPGVPRRLAATPGYLNAFARFVRAVSPDVLHSNSLYSFAEAFSGRALGVPTVLHLHDMAPASWKAEPVRQIARRVVDLSVAVSQACADSYETGGWSPTVVHGAAPLPTERCEIRRDPKPFVVGTVGVISRRKGTDVFVEAAERLRTTNPGIELHMIGSPTDPLDRRWGVDLLKRARSAGIRHRDHADVASALREWDAFVLPSRRDPFPLVMLEAMAAGLPAIGARVDGIEEQLSPRSGVLVTPEDPAELAATIRRVAALSMQERLAMADAARSRVEANFTLERQATGMDSAYRSVISA